MNESQSKIKRVIIISLLIALLIDFIPFSGSFFQWLPEFTALILFYWLINRPQYIGIGVAFIIGLLVDVGTAAPLGQHALAYILSAYVIERYQRQLVIYDYGIQSIAVLAALMLNQVVLMIVQLLITHQFEIWLTFLAPFIGALLWPMLNKIMLTILNARRFR